MEPPKRPGQREDPTNPSPPTEEEERENIPPEPGSSSEPDPPNAPPPSSEDVSTSWKHVVLIAFRANSRWHFLEYRVNDSFVCLFKKKMLTRRRRGSRGMRRRSRGSRRKIVMTRSSSFRSKAGGDLSYWGLICGLWSPGTATESIDV